MESKTKRDLKDRIRIKNGQIRSLERENEKLAAAAKRLGKANMELATKLQGKAGTV